MQKMTRGLQKRLCGQSRSTTFWSQRRRSASRALSHRLRLRPLQRAMRARAASHRASLLRSVRQSRQNGMLLRRHPRTRRKPIRGLRLCPPRFSSNSSNSSQRRPSRRLSNILRSATIGRKGGLRCILRQAARQSAYRSRRSLEVPHPLLGGYSGRPRVAKDTDRGRRRQLVRHT
jgi:hypothetical protein